MVDVALRVAFLFIAAACAGFLSFRQRALEVTPFDKRETLNLRGLLVSCVVLGHAGAMIGWRSFATPATSMFFFISGYGLVKKMSGLEQADENVIKGFVTSSAKKLLMPLFLVTILGQLWLVVTGRFDVDLIQKFLLLGETPLLYSWFVYVLFALYCVFCFAWKFIRCSVGRLLFVLCATILYLFVVHFVFRWPWWWKWTVLAFPVGVCWSMFEEEFVCRIKRFPVRWFILVGMILACSFLPNGLSNRLFDGVLLWFMGPMVLSFLYFVPLKSVKVLEMLGKVSFEMYLVHGLFVNDLLGVGSWYLALVFVASFFVGWILHCFDAYLLGRLA